MRRVLVVVAGLAAALPLAAGQTYEWFEDTELDGCNYDCENNWRANAIRCRETEAGGAVNILPVALGNQLCPDPKPTADPASRVFDCNLEFGLLYTFDYGLVEPGGDSLTGLEDDFLNDAWVTTIFHPKVVTVPSPAGVNEGTTDWLDENRPSQDSLRDQGDWMYQTGRTTTGEENFDSTMDADLSPNTGPTYGDHTTGLSYALAAAAGGGAVPGGYWHVEATTNPDNSDYLFDSPPIDSALFAGTCDVTFWLHAWDKTNAANDLLYLRVDWVNCDDPTEFTMLKDIDTREASVKTEFGLTSGPGHGREDWFQVNVTLPATKPVASYSDKFRIRWRARNQGGNRNDGDWALDDVMFSTGCGPASESPSPTPSASPTVSNSASETATPSHTPSVTDTPSPTPSASATPTPTRTPSATPTPTRTPSATPTPTRTPSPTPTPSHTPSHTPSATPTATATVTDTPSSTASPSATRSSSPSPSATRSSSPSSSATRSSSQTATASPSFVPTNSHTPTQTPSHTASASATPSHTASPSPTASATPTRTATATPSATHTPSATPSPTRTPSATSSATPSASTSASASASASTTASASPSASTSASSSATASATPSSSVTASATASATPSASASPTMQSRLGLFLNENTDLAFMDRGALLALLLVLAALLLCCFCFCCFWFCCCAGKRRRKSSESEDDQVPLAPPPDELSWWQAFLVCLGCRALSGGQRGNSSALAPVGAGGAGGSRVTPTSLATANSVHNLSHVALGLAAGGAAANQESGLVSRRGDPIPMSALAAAAAAAAAQPGGAAAPTGFGDNHHATGWCPYQPAAVALGPPPSP